MGVTGTREQVSGDASGLVSRLRPFTDGPVAVGLGVSTAEQATEVARYADGVIVGSAFVRCLLEASSPADGVAAVGKLAAELAEGVRRGPAGT
jgi:tryptophan synthase alpha chain